MQTPMSLHSSKSLLALCLLSYISVSHSQSIVQLHGSGTTNPSKCYWRIMDQMMQRSKVPLRMSYRAVGSSTGIFEFTGVNNTTPFSYKSFNDFGSGDIPIPSETYAALKNEGVELVHLPFVLGAISFFHSIPDLGSGLNLTSCQISRILKREIVFWDDSELEEDNPNMQVPYVNYPIKVAHRVKGSSSTASITEYLHKTCPEEWSESSVGATITWDEDTMGCEGSGGMTDCIRNFPGTIGYIDSGHGHAENLVEIELKNDDGTFLSSKEAGGSGIKRAALEALEQGIVPNESTMDYGDVKLLNMPGKNTWPIVAMTYVYARVDINTILPDPAAQSLLKYFLQSLYDPDVIGQCSVYGFTPVPDRVADIALAGIDLLKLDDGAPVWTTEPTTMKGVGQGDYVFSVKRRTYAELQSSDIQAQLDSTAVLTTAPSSGGSSLSDEDRDALDTSLVYGKMGMAFGIVSILLWAITFIFLIMKKLGCF